MHSEKLFVFIHQLSCNNRSLFLKEELPNSVPQKQIAFGIILFSLNTGFLARDFIHTQPKDAYNDIRQAFK